MREIDPNSGDIGAWGGLMILLTHGFSSSFIFFIAHLAYSRSFSRRVIINQNRLTWSAGFSLMWFLRCVGMMGGPPASTIVSEILGILVVLAWWPKLVGVLVLSAFLAGLYRIMLFARVYHGNSRVPSRSVQPVSHLELSICSFHAFWLLLYFWIFTWVIMVK